MTLFRITGSSSNRSDFVGENFSSLLGRATLVWSLIIVAETVHGIARQLLLEPLVGDLGARQIGVLIGSIIIILISFIFVRWLKASGMIDLIAVGVLWVFLTLGFEILLGRFVMNASWDRLASDYDVRNGGLMLFGMLIMLFAPLVMAKFTDEI